MNTVSVLFGRKIKAIYDSGKAKSLGPISAVPYPWDGFAVFSFLDIQLCCFLAGIYVCVHLFGCQNKSACFQKLVFKCFLCTCAANDAGREATAYILVALRASAGASREAASGSIMHGLKYI